MSYLNGLPKAVQREVYGSLDREQEDEQVRQSKFRQARIFNKLKNKYHSRLHRWE